MNAQSGFLLSYLKYGENDAIIHAFTENDGFQSYFLKGIYTKKNKKKAFLLPLNKLNFAVNMARGNGIPTISKLELDHFYDLYSDINANTVVFFISDFLNQILRIENKNTVLFIGIDEFLQELDRKNYQSHLILLIKILKILGVAPLINEGQYLNPETGVFALEMAHHFFDEHNSLIWKNILSSESPYEIKIPSKFRRNFLDSILIYYHYHFADFKTPGSLEIIQQIFE
ncbi:DNA repair protein RecO [Chryseobacterium sp. RG1]|uniref:DNA repair protein RecO n=1 Tax=Chryseobacterium tagetis TaxID=2801334 RepID=A0ABS8A3Q2_9FLAO|nr:DNA repair protein RecO [Chryseobacterium tagetis]MCA6068616.1 DNA repair protein RecO [Chryseobacterium tagetis]